MVLTDLHIPVEVGFLDDIGHSRLDDLEAVFCAVYAMPGKSVDHSVHRLLKGGIGISFCELIRTDLPEQLLQNIDHRKRVGDPERGEEI